MNPAPSLPCEDAPNSDGPRGLPSRTTLRKPRFQEACWGFWRSSQYSGPVFVGKRVTFLEHTPLGLCYVSLLTPESRAPASTNDVRGFPESTAIRKTSQMSADDTYCDRYSMVRSGGTSPSH
jgi:hypothetical protein